MDGIAFFHSAVRSNLLRDRRHGGAEERDEGGQGVFPSVAEWLSISFWVTAMSRVLGRFEVDP